MKFPKRLLVGIIRYFSRPSMHLGFALLLGTSCIATASVLDSKHNLSVMGPGTVKSKSETQVCVFCHTPHGADQTAGGPLWNRQQSTSTYIPYLSSSTDANPIPGQPAASSKVCLSCHDGTLAIGLVINLNGRSGNIAMVGTGTGGVMPDGTVAGSGYTSVLGTDLTNDHPISITYDTDLANKDGELRPPPVVSGTKYIVANRAFGVKPVFPLESSQIQCSTCHDPHLSSDSSPKFLRGLRLQKGPPSLASYIPANDIMCVACHDKDNSFATWSYSAHANSNEVAVETYTPDAATRLEFPPSTTVWQASCLGCHDPHTVPGARRLLREGTDSGLIPKIGGHSAIEETCYQCHSTSIASVLNQSSPPDMVPDIKTDFLLTYRMPICCKTETHDIGGNFNDNSGGGLASSTAGTCNTATSKCGKDLMESEALLGKQSAGGTIGNRHTECTDCHNPHRTIRNRLFNGNPTSPVPPAAPNDAGTHKHNIASGDTVAHSNIASGSLRGIFGVEPVYTADDFGTAGIPLSFDVKRGDPGTSVFTAVNQTFVTREYQVCLKCHSNYAYDTPPILGSPGSGGTPQYTNGFDTYLNTAMEIQAPAGHKGETTSTTSSGAYSTYSSNNHRSWHPVMDSTGRTVASRGNASPNLWRSPWNGSAQDGGSSSINTAVDRYGNLTPVTGAVGNQTMYCSDCHGTVNDIANGVVPDNNGSALLGWTENGKPWGPHGSSQIFILKGPAPPAPYPDATTPIGITSDTLCFRCHNAAQYADASGAAPTMTSGFSGTGNDNAYGTPINNLHQRHAYYTTQGGVTHTPVVGIPYVSAWPSSANGSYRCTMCHTGTAHGWKNKDFLVNLNDIGPELNKNIYSTVGGALGTSTGGTGEIAPGPVTLTTGENVPSGTLVPGSMASVLTGGYTNGPYYRGALLYINYIIGVNGFKASGTWTKSDCANSGCH